MTDPKTNFHKKFGKLTILEDYYRDKKSNLYYKVMCDCDNEKYVAWDKLQSGKTKSCGCLRKEVNSKIHFIHGYRYSRIYSIWEGMVTRTTNKKRKAFKDYGGRGITVCDEWLNSFENFKEWALNNGYRDDLTIDRIDVNGNYCPQNCRWATRLDQNRNQRVRKNNKLGVKGVYKVGRKYRVYISHHGKQIRLGCFEDLEDAIEARKKAEEYYWQNKR